MVSFTKNQQNKNNATRAGLRQRSTKHSSENRSSTYSSDNSSCSSYIVDSSSEEDDQEHYVNLNGRVIFKSGEHRRSETIYSETENESPNSKIIVDNTTQLDNDYDQSYEEESSSGSCQKYIIMGCLFAVLLIAVIATCVATKKHTDEDHTDIVVVKGNSSDASAHANQGRSCCCCAVLLTVGILAFTGVILGCAACCCGWCCCEDTATDAPSGSTCAELVNDDGEEYYCADGYIFDAENAELVLEVTTLDNFQVNCCAIDIED